MPIINQVVKGGGSSVAEPYLEFSIDAQGRLASTTSRIIDLTGVTTMNRSFKSMYKGNPNITGVVNFGDIQTIAATDGNSAFEECFQNCPNITGVRMDNLTTIYGGNAFLRAFYQSGVTFASFDKLETIDFSSYMFQYAFAGSSISSFNFRCLKSAVGTGIFGHAFLTCNSLITGRFPSLSSVSRSTFMNCFDSCSSLQSLWFYALNTTSFGTRTDQFNDMLSGCSNVTVHFPMAIQSTIGSWTSVTGGFSGTNTTVLFDLVTSLTGADSNTYTRQEKDSTATATAWVYNDTLYYTSGVSDNTNGVNEPAVSDAIYSDAACTQSVTTITAIA